VGYFQPVLDYLIYETAMPEASARQSVRLLYELNWPDVTPDELMVSRKGVLLFHPTAAVVGRIEHCKRIQEHPLVAPALRTRTDTQRCSLEFGVGLLLQPTISEEECLWVAKQLALDDLSWNDIRRDNLGRLPLVTQQFPDGLPALVDRDFITNVDPAKRHNKRYEDYGVAPEQAAAFRGKLYELRRQLLLAWPAGQDTIITQEVAAFWQLAHNLTAANLAQQATLAQPFAQGWADAPIGFEFDRYGKGAKARDIHRAQQRRLLIPAP
jgi:hypothetical protein